MFEETIIIDGSNFSDLETFYDELACKLTRGVDFKLGRNFSAFNDVLSGGFGLFDYEETAKIVWLNSEKSRHDLGWPETIRYIEQKVLSCHHSNIDTVKQDLQSARRKEGQTLFELLVDTIREHDHLVLELS